MTIKSAIIFTNTKRESIKEALPGIISFLEDKKGIAVKIIDLSYTVEDLKIKAIEGDLAISLGGDGTVLTCAAILKDSSMPVLGVKLGTFGYITETTTDEFEEVFNAFEKGETPIQERLMIEASVVRKDKTIFKTVALNDFTISGKSFAKLVKLNLSVNDVLAANIKGDGLIIATPTGSTAYSLAAGGPILEASLKALIINAICPFSMNVRPLVVSDSSQIIIDIPVQGVKLAITSDGHEVYDLEDNDKVIIKKSTSKVLFVENPKRQFIEIVRDRLGWAGGFNA
ncbi:MAG: NAD(+)/NADH kinase [Sphaerochaetaceae bacterium]|nr:NAD(+)/NADH kinase [Sphaerochaetaceae bacterium]